MIAGGGMVLVGSGLQPSSEHPLPSEILEDQESIEDVPYNKWSKWSQKYMYKVKGEGHCQIKTKKFYS